MKTGNPWLCVVIVGSLAMCLFTALFGLIFDPDNRALPPIATGALGALSSYMSLVPARGVGLQQPPTPPASPQ